MKKTLAITLLILTTNVTAAPADLGPANSLFTAILELQKANYAGPKACLTPSQNKLSNNNLNSLGDSALAKHQANTKFIKVETTASNNKPEQYFTSLFPAVLAKHYKTAPVSN
jgi:hypothetical protein